MKLPVVEARTAPWYAQGLQFTCTQCGNCCTGGPGYVWISKTEIARMAEYLRISTDQVIDRYCRRIGSRYSLKEQRSPAGLYDCIFLKEIPAVRHQDGKTITYNKRICEVYPVRPLQCRTWPFWDGLLANEKEWEKAAEGCPGMNRGKNYSREQVEALRYTEDWPD